MKDRFVYENSIEWRTTLSTLNQMTHKTFLMKKENGKYIIHPLLKLEEEIIEHTICSNVLDSEIEKVKRGEIQ